MHSDGKRLFVGIPVSLATVDALAGAAESLARRAQTGKVKVRWLAPATYHVTVKFLGWCRAETIDAVADGVRRALEGVDPLRFQTARLGAFPKPEKATVVWAGVEDSGGKLAAIAEKIDAEMTALGFAPESRRFHPHVTIGRLRDPADVSGVILPMAEQLFSETRCNDVIVYESLTKSTGSEYVPLVRAPLGARKSQPLRVQRAHGEQGPDSTDPDPDPDSSSA
jgi:RNA 2',3'-cyclic 3'-phosphodiesterase